MTASTIAGADRASFSAPFGRFAGLAALLRKDTTEWVRGRRAWVVLIVATAFMLLTAANGWIESRIAAALPPGEIPLDQIGSLAPVDNLLAAVSAQIFVMATVFVAGSLIARDREAGTLAWVASKPVTRASIWTSKWVSSTAMLSILGGILPLAATAILVTVLYGALPIGLVVGLAVGVVLTIAFFAAVSLALGTILPGQAATIAAGFAVFALLPIVGSLLPIGSFLPSAMLTWPAEALSGVSVAWATPISWLVVTGGLAALAIGRTGRMEL